MPELSCTVSGWCFLNMPPLKEIIMFCLNSFLKFENQFLFKTAQFTELNLCIVAYSVSAVTCYCSFNRRNNSQKKPPTICFIFFLIFFFNDTGCTVGKKVWGRHDCAFFISCERHLNSLWLCWNHSIAENICRKELAFSLPTSLKANFREGQARGSFCGLF